MKDEREEMSQLYDIFQWGIEAAFRKVSIFTFTTNYKTGAVRKWSYYFISQFDGTMLIEGNSINELYKKVEAYHFGDKTKAIKIEEDDLL